MFHRQKKFPLKISRDESERRTERHLSASEHHISDTMGGRQAHGRAITAKPLGKSAKKSAAKKGKNHRTRALDAYQLASEELPGAEKKAPRHRNPDIDVARPKHGLDEDEDVEEQGPRRKKAKQAREEEDDGSDVEYGSDEDGNKWTMGGPVGEEDDSEIDSDEAFGETDEEDFEGFAFGGSKSKNAEVGPAAAASHREERASNG